MKAFVVTGPFEAGVHEVEDPVAGPGEVVVDVAYAGVCGTDVEIFTGELSYLHDGSASFPMRLGHEWAGVVSSAGPGVDASWVGRRVTCDTMMGCGHCPRCQDGFGFLCEDRDELGIRGDKPGAMAERVRVPVRSLVPVPDGLDLRAAAMIEPGGNAFRAASAAQAQPGQVALVLGAGTIGLLTAMFVRATGAAVHLMDPSDRARSFAHAVGFPDTWSTDEVPPLRWDCVVDAANSPEASALAVELAEPGRRVVLIGYAGRPSMLDARRIVGRNLTVVGILSASGALAEAAEAYAAGTVDPTVLVGGEIMLGDVAAVLGGTRPASVGPGPKLLVRVGATGPSAT